MLLLVGHVVPCVYMEACGQKKEQFEPTERRTPLRIRLRT
jgi:hypothetical protein